MEVKSKGLALFLLLALALLQGICPVSAASPAAKVLTGVVSNAVSAIVKRLWTFKYSTKPAVTSHRAMMKFESGYNVETVFDGSKLGIEPYSVQVTQSGELLVLDSANSNLYHIALPLSRYSRPKLVAGSPDGDAGHVDGRLREARMNHPQSLTVDDKGNIYVADTMNMAIRKISDTGVTTIAGGKYNRGGHVDGPSEDAKFSTDFEVVYISSSCSLLVVDRGNQAIREIQLHFDDCASQYEGGFPLGIAVLFAAGFFGYMLALLQRRVGHMVSAKDEPQAPQNHNMPPYQKPMKSVRPPLIPTVDDLARAEAEEGLFASLGKLLTGAWSSTTEILGAMLIFRRKPQNNLFQQQQRRANAWPVQDSFVIPEDEIPPPLEARTPSTHKTYAFMSKEPEKIHQVRHGHAYFSGWDGQQQQHLQQQQKILQQQHLQQQQKIHQQQHLQQQQQQQKIHHHHHQHLQQHRQYSSGPQTFYEQSCETTKEIVFGAVQELDNNRRNVEIRSVNYGDPFYEQHGLRYRNSYMGYDNIY